MKCFVLILFALFPTVSFAEGLFLIAQITSDRDKLSEQHLFVKVDDTHAVTGFQVMTGDRKVKSYKMADFAQADGQVIRRAYRVPTTYARFSANELYNNGGTLSLSFRSGLFGIRWMGYRFQIRQDHNLEWKLMYRDRPVERIQLQYQDQVFPQKINVQLL